MIWRNSLSGGIPRKRLRRLPVRSDFVREVRSPTVDGLLRTCPTLAERRQIHRDFNIVFDVPAPGFRCTYGGSETSMWLTVYNMFRAMKLINFDAPMPLIGVTNLYVWFRSLGLTYYMGDYVYSHAGGNEIHLRLDAINSTHFSSRVWMDLRAGGGLQNVIGLLVHEARHTVPGGGFGHNCGPTATGGASDGVRMRDSRLSWGGAYALQYWYYYWLGNHSAGYLSPDDKFWANVVANSILEGMFCEPHVRRRIRVR